MRRAARIGIATGLAALLLGLGGIGVFGRPSASPVAPALPPTAEALTGPIVPGTSLAAVIGSLQTRLQERPDDWRSFAALGLAYVQQARVTADPSYYPKAEQALERSLALENDTNFDALVGQGALHLARHGFADALGWGRRAAALNPYDGSAYGVIGDALLELGRYEQAFRTYQRMVDAKPDLSSYARVSYARELQGDTAGAVEAMELAFAAAGTPEDAAWASNQLGDLFFNVGELDRADVAYRRAIELAPGFVPPQAGLSRVAWAAGDTREAIRLLSQVVRRYPLPEHVVALGDMHAVAGRPRLAEAQYDLARAERELFRAGGVNVDLELALFDADHGSPQEALSAARAEWERRRSVHVADALAWALYASGDLERAARYSERALGLGTKNASFLYHAAMIRLGLDDEASARRLLEKAMAINPHFSILYSAQAAEILERLGGAR